MHLVKVSLTILVLTGLYLMTRENRSVRNNNPLNIERGADWVGLQVMQNDRRFAQFKKPEYGFRAGYIILLQYLERGDNTIEKIVSKWAPSSDNNHTGNYIDYISDKMNVSEFKELEPSYLAQLMLHMSNFEGGNGHFTIEQANQGIALANQENFVIARLARLGYEVYA